MTLSSIIRKSASSFCSLSGRLFRVRGSGSSFIFNSVNDHGNVHCRRSLGVPLVNSFRDFSSSKRPSSSESLVRVIESEIKCASETDDHDRVEDVPQGFPFEIQDAPGLQTVTLKKTYQDEVISVEVHMPDLVTGQNTNDHDDDDDDNDQKASQSSIPLVVSVSKKSGPCLEFSCSAYPDEISIDSMTVKHPEQSEDQISYEGPDFQDLDENLQKAFHKYLEIRGIKPSTTNFLHEYMINKDSKEYLIWLKKLKSFVEA